MGLHCFQWSPWCRADSFPGRSLCEHQAGQQAGEDGAQSGTGGLDETSARPEVTLPEDVREYLRQRKGFNSFKGPMKMQR